MLTSKTEIDIKIDLDDIYREIGYDSGARPQSRVRSIVDEYIERVNDLIEPAYYYVIKNVEVVDGSSVLIGNNVVFKSDVVARLLKRCTKVAVSIVTIGGYLEGTARRLAKDGNMLQASILDAIGSQAVHKVAESVQNEIRRIARGEGLMASKRYSPGYCDWDIAQQLLVFRALGRKTTPVRLTDRCLMIPSKSISGIIGLGPRGSGVDQYNPCGTCSKVNCVGREVPV